MDIEKFAAAMAPVIRASVERATAPLLERIAELEARKMDVEHMVEGKVAGWALDFERRAQGVLERAVDRMPRPADGKDGRDGIGFDDLTVEHDGERGVVLRFTRGSEVKEFPMSFPVTIDRGVYKEDSDYQRGDAVTWGGSLWIAQKDAPESKPGMGDGWRLAVKKGRDGRDGK